MQLTIAQFDYVIYYLALYAAKDGLAKAGLELELVSTGNDDSAVEAVCSKRADVALCDPSMAALAMQGGKPCSVIGQLAHKAPMYLITLNQLYEPAKPAHLAHILRNSRLSTYPKPSTTYACTCSFLKRIGLEPGKDVELLQTPFRDELGPLFSAESEFAIVNEPICTQAAANGAKVLRALSEDFGSMTFSGLTIRKGFGKKPAEHRSLSLLMKGIRQGMQTIHKDQKAALAAARSAFPEIAEDHLKKSIAGLVKQDILVRTPSIPRADWDALAKLRLESGELKSAKFAEVLDMRYAR
jgi:ABC-type nitrate/sulfonate/bicarbonate transport system substrate-binding protein